MQGLFDTKLHFYEIGREIKRNEAYYLVKCGKIWFFSTDYAGIAVLVEKYAYFLDQKTNYRSRWSRKCIFDLFTHIKRHDLSFFLDQNCFF